MNKIQKDFLIRLLNEPAPSGFETPVQKIWKDETQSFCPDITQDAHGNLTAVLNRGKAKSIMIVGHSDEIGLIVNYINDNGFIFVRAIGGVEPAILGSHRARIITSGGIVHGAIGKTSLHLSQDNEKRVVKIHDIWIDIGAKNKKDALKSVSIGDPVIFGADYQELSNNIAMARCWDNRVGIYVVAEVIRKLSANKKMKHTVYGVSSVQEETGVWSAGNAAYLLKPTVAIAIDVMPSTDNPGISIEKFGETKVGKGPVICRGVRTNNIITSELIQTAKRRKIPFQIDAEYGYTGTDADPISQVRGGIPIGVVSIATRYLHSSVETLSLTDIDHTINLVTGFILSSSLNLN